MSLRHKDLNLSGGGRRDLVYLNTQNRWIVEKAFDYFANVLIDSRTRIEFSHVFLDAEREVNMFNYALYDIDTVIYDYSANDILAFVEFKTREQINYLHDSMLYSKNQYDFAKKVAEITNKPYLWLIRAGNGQRWWYLTDISKIPEPKVMKYKNKEFVLLEKDKMLTLTDEQLKDWIIQHIL